MAGTEDIGINPATAESMPRGRAESHSGRDFKSFVAWPVPNPCRFSSSAISEWCAPAAFPNRERMHCSARNLLITKQMKKALYSVFIIQTTRCMTTLSLMLRSHVARRCSLYPGHAGVMIAGEMRPAIIVKLEKELAEPIQSERQVVYIMVELRKLLELTGDKKHYPALLLHTNWVAHPCLERDLAAEIVMAFNHHAREIHRMKQMKLGDARQVDDSHLPALNRAFTLTAFRTDLLNYLDNAGLDSSIGNDDEKWATFLKYYCAVIRDCPLRCSLTKLKSTQ
jgi:hypothetical protein